MCSMAAAMRFCRSSKAPIRSLKISGRDLDFHVHLVQPFFTREHYLVMRQRFFDREDCRFDLRWKDVHAADNDHVVAAVGDAADAAQTSARKGMPRSKAR